MTSADLVVAVSTTADGQVVFKRSDPNLTHPYSMSELLEKVNSRRKGRPITTHDHQVMCWKESLRDNPKYAWKHSNGSTSVWSGDALHYFAKLEDTVYDQARLEYRAFRRASKL